MMRMAPPAGILQTLLMSACFGAGATATTCSWVENTDYYGPNVGHGGVNLTRQECCDLCTKTKGCDFAVFGSPSETPPCSCWFKSGLATNNRYGYRYGATTCCPLAMVGGCPQGLEPKKVPSTLCILCAHMQRVQCAAASTMRDCSR
eukprot:SAG31_NODE_16585_length_703_cov_1.081126_1_plen_147_part_00